MVFFNCDSDMDENEGVLMKIGPRTRAKAVELVGNLLEGYQQQIETAYSKAEVVAVGNGALPKSLDVSLKVRFAPAGEYGIKIIAKIGFVESKIADEIAEIVDEEQMSLEL